MASDTPAWQFEAAPTSFFQAAEEQKSISEMWAGQSAPAPASTEPKRPDLSGPLLSCKAFIELQGAGADLAEAKKAYQQYRQEYELRFAEIFYTDHKTEPWFVEKYHPEKIHEAMQGRVLAAQLRQKQFISDFQAKAFTGIMLRDSTEPAYGPPMFAFDPNALTLFLGLVPTSVWRKEVLTAVHAIPGFCSLSLSEPIPSQGFGRFAWVRLDSQAHCDEACRLLSNVQVTSQYAITATPSQKVSRRPLKTQPPQSLPGLTADWKRISELIKHLDAQYQLAENQLLVAEDRFLGLDPMGKEEQVDLQLLYLRRVFGTCYYCAEFCEEERELAAKCGSMHLRSKVNGEQESPGSLTDEKFAELLKKCVMPSYDPAKDEKLQSSIDSLVSSLILPEATSKVRCSSCKKLFFDEKFLRKHIHAKHQELLGSITGTHYDKLMFERFLLESCKFVFANNGGDNPRAQKRAREEQYEDLDDPKNRRTRRVVDYSDI